MKSLKATILYVIFNHCFAWSLLNNAMPVNQNKERHSLIMNTREIPFVLLVSAYLKGCLFQEISIKQEHTSSLRSLTTF